MAASFAVLATAPAAAGYHLAFSGTAAVAGCLVAVLAFACGLLREPQPRSLLSDLGAMGLAQVSACCCFAFLSPDFPLADPAVHSDAGAAVHLATTMVTVCALRAAKIPRSRPSAMAHEVLCAFAHRLRALTSARTTPTPVPCVSRYTSARGCGDEEAVSEVLLDGAVGRRGPP
ncbi:hypothetical protein OHT59_10620 [Streptomyces sp. NBC_00243]|uniref:hypothetical protein n=1 Tax=Streptomyces sp. NBC_00243 TaxID=2975688 RepID=UPI002DD971C6|nr:hypothetical protein [Streptomyces sp. NBC_00243]WRZ26233.1 hypothetical protein OHT59_10620 [Streptomyces sp. NBC_00243]